MVQGTEGRQARVGFVDDERPRGACTRPVASSGAEPEVEIATCDSIAVPVEGRTDGRRGEALLGDIARVGPLEVESELVATLAGRTATGIQNLRIVVFVTLAGYGDKVLACGQRNIDQRILADVIVVDRNDRELSGDRISLEQCQVGIEVARVVQTLGDGFQSDLSVGDQFEAVQVDIAVIGSESMLTVGLIDDPWENLFEGIRVGVQTGSYHSSIGVGYPTVAIAAHDRPCG